METKFFVGLDVHKESTSFAVRDLLGNVLKEGETATLYEDVRREIGEYLDSAVVGLEASTSYYTLYQNFLKNKCRVRVANTIQMRQLIAKNDKLDARRLAEMLRLGTFPASYIPSVELQKLRSFVSLRHSLMEERTRCNVRIQAFLDRCGVVMPSCKAFSQKWKSSLLQYLGGENASLEIRHEYDHYAFLEQKGKHVDWEMIGYARKHWGRELGLVESITGFGPVLSCYVIAHVLPIERFASEKKLRRYAGVVPTFLESGNKRSAGRLPKTSSRGQLRWALIQAANAIGKTKGRLGQYYRKKKKQKKKSGTAKMAVASSLVDIIYAVLTTKKPYASA
jgi:transposase